MGTHRRDRAANLAVAGFSPVQPVEMVGAPGAEPTRSHGSNQERVTPWQQLLIVFGCVVAVGAIGNLDGQTDPLMSWTVAYLVPVVLAAWWAGTWPGVAVGVLAGMAFTGAEMLHHQAMGTLVWNVASKLLVFVSFAGVTARVSHSQMRLAIANHRLEAAAKREALLARTDPHTGLPNYRAFVDHVQHEAARRRRDGRPLCIAFLDLDNFKRVNDEYGHAVGDELLRGIGEGIRDAVRAGDEFARMGGDEFAIAFAEAERNGAERIAERILDRVAEIGRRYSSAGVTASAGIAWFRHAPAGTREIMESADVALYQAKRAGKNRVVVLTDMESGTLPDSPEAGRQGESYARDAGIGAIVPRDGR